MRPPKPTRVEAKLIRENSALKTQVICLRYQLSSKQDDVRRLEHLLVARLAKINDLTGRLEQESAEQKAMQLEASDNARAARYAKHH